MTVDQFERALEGFGESMSNLEPILTQIGGRLVDQIKCRMHQRERCQDTV